MNEFFHQYEEELRNQEKRANERTIKSFFLVVVGTAVAWALTMLNIFEISKLAITIAFLIALIMAVPTLYIYRNKDLSKSGYKYHFMASICVLCGIVMSFLSYHVYLLSAAPLLFAMQYRKKSVIRFVFVMNTITMTIATLVGYYYGLCDMNLFFGGLHTRKGMLEALATGADWMTFNENFFFVVVVFVILPRDLILVVFSLIVEYAIASGEEDAMKIAKLTHLKETDENTHVFNKNKYLEMTSEYYPEVDWVGVIFFDLNNLKTINDKYGHQIGDLAIETLSGILNQFTSEKTCVYRVGGDEFLVIVENPVEGFCETIVENVKESLQSGNKHREFSIHTAAGIAFGNGIDILDIVELADENMYKDKLKSKS